MRRKGWSTVEVPDGWMQIIRGPRPRAIVQTPMQQKPSATVAHRQVVSMPQQSKLQNRPRRPPAEVRAVASTKILRIQAAIASFGVDDIEERSSLEAALSRAQRLLVIPPVDKRIEDTSASVARAKKRIAAESVKIKQAEKQRQVFEEELDRRRGIWNPTGGRDFTSRWVRTMPAGVAGPSGCV